MTYFMFSYPAPRNVLARGARDASLKDSLHMIRDMGAFSILQPTLSEFGDFGGILFNFNPEAYSGTPHAKMPLLTAEDLLVMTTRPPLSDDMDDKRSIMRSDSEIEEMVLDGVKEFFSHCSRQRVILAEGLAEGVDYHAIQYRVKCGPSYYRMGTVQDMWKLEKLDKRDVKETGGYIVSIPNLVASNGEPGPRFLAIFAMAGTENLLWAYLIQKKFPELIGKLLRSDKKRLVVGEFTPDVPTESIPLDLSFCDEWDVKMGVVDVTFD